MISFKKCSRQSSWMFVLYYSKKEQLLGNNLIENLQFYSVKYELHVDFVKNILIDFLQKNEKYKI